jgi:hypothetical protein
MGAHDQALRRNKMLTDKPAIYMQSDDGHYLTACEWRVSEERGVGTAALEGTRTIDLNTYGMVFCIATVHGGGPGGAQVGGDLGHLVAVPPDLGASFESVPVALGGMLLPP